MLTRHDGFRGFGYMAGRFPQRRPRGGCAFSESVRPEIIELFLAALDRSTSNGRPNLDEDSVSQWVVIPCNMHLAMRKRSESWQAQNSDPSRWVRAFAWRSSYFRFLFFPLFKEQSDSGQRGVLRPRSRLTNGKSVCDLSEKRSLSFCRSASTGAAAQQGSAWTQWVGHFHSAFRFGAELDAAIPPGRPTFRLR
jgi:hypothetical protein